MKTMEISEKNIYKISSCTGNPCTGNKRKLFSEQIIRLFFVLSQNFCYGIPSFTRGKFSAIQSEKFPFLEINASTKAIFITRE